MIARLAQRAVAMLVAAACSSPSPAPTPDKSLGPPEPTAARRVAVELATDAGTIHCTLDALRTPRAVALFTGLASGGAAWRDPATGVIRKDPLYHDLPFHRVISGALIQGGCPKGDGTGHPGYRIEVELGGEETLRAAGALVLARYTRPPGREDPDPPPPGHVLGSQFGITLRPMPHLAGDVTVIGRCTDLDVVARIADERDPSARARLQRIDVR